MKRKVIEYMYVTNGASTLCFVEEINRLIGEGWQPLGGIAVTYNGDDQMWDTWQAMVKYE